MPDPDPESRNVTYNIKTAAENMQVYVNDGTKCVKIYKGDKRTTIEMVPNNIIFYEGTIRVVAMLASPYFDINYKLMSGAEGEYGLVFRANFFSIGSIFTSYFNSPPTVKNNSTFLLIVYIYEEESSNITVITQFNVVFRCPQGTVLVENKVCKPSGHKSVIGLSIALAVVIVASAAVIIYVVKSRVPNRLDANVFYV